MNLFNTSDPASLVARLRHLRHRLFDRGPSPEEWERRLERIVAQSVAESLRWIPADGAFVDVGANIGVYAEAVLRARPGVRAWLFEPVQEHFERCRARFAGCPGVVVEPLALGDDTGKKTILKARHNPGGNVLDHELAARWRRHENAKGEAERPIHFRRETVRCRPFDDYACERGLEPVDLVKIDTEGFDHRVLRGMLRFLERCDPKPVILAELWGADIFPDFAGQVAVVERLYGLGYGHVDLLNIDLVQDFLFVPKGRAPLH